MNIKGALIAVLIGIGVLFISKWMVFANILLIPYIILFFKTEKFKCNKCGNVQVDNIVLSKKNNSSLTHGRYTKSGGLDKRYNSTFKTSITFDYGIICKNCKNIYHVERTY